MNAVTTAPRPEAAAIERRHQLPYADFERDYLRPNKPVILTGALDCWPALGKWSPEYFQQRYGTLEVNVGGRPRPMAEFIDLVLASTAEQPAPYLKDAAVRHMSPELIQDIEPFVEYAFPNWLRGRYLFGSISELLNMAEVELFLGGAGARLGELHCDYVHTHTVLCQLFGRKEFTLFAPEDTPWLYADGNQSALKRVDEVDLQRYPLFAKATPIRFAQEPGEIVFLPSGWWHTTRLLTASIAVGVNFANATNWPALTEDLVERIPARRPIRRALVRTYLKAVGWWKRLQGCSAGAAKLGIIPAQGRR
jgi:histone arginine demethylase JMJD6